MSAVSSKNEPTIGGLPASRFQGRRIKAMLPDGVFTTVIGRGFYKKSILVDAVIQGRLRQYQVSPKHVKPNWVENGDLQQEAVALGLRFTGEVNVGRAMEVAKAAVESPVVEVKSAIPDFAPPMRVPELEPPAAEPEPDPEPQPEPPPIEPMQEPIIPEPESPPVTEQLPPAVSSPVAGFEEITGVQASITADPTWMSDFADLQTLIASGRVNRERLAALRREIQELEAREGDDRDLIELYVESLSQKGVVVQRGRPRPQVAQPQVVVRPQSSFENRFSNWLSDHAPERFTFEEATAAVGVVDNSPRRISIKAIATAAGYSTTIAKRGQKLVFFKEVAGG